MTAFVQDEIALFGNRLAVTLGSQVQHDSDSGAGVQPTARVMWKVRPRQRLWAATSRALRTPSLYDRGIRVDYPPVPSPERVATGRHACWATRRRRPRRLVDAEAGYRLEIGTTASIDVTGFVGRYDHLRTQEVAAPVVQFVPSPHILVTSQFGNQLEATTRGLEVAGHWTPVPAWRLDGSYTAFHLTPQLAATSQDPAAATEDGSAPRAQWQVRSAFSPDPRATLNVAIFHVGPARAAPGRRLHASRRQRGVAVHQPPVRHGDRPEPLRRGARRVRRRRRRCCWRRRSRAAPACGCDGRSDDVHAARSRPDGSASRASRWPRRSSRRPRSRPPAAPDVAPDVAVKAAFLFNFAKFAEWPALPAGAPIVVCIVGDDGIAAALVDTVRGQNISGHALEVRRPQDSAAWRACHLLFIADAEARRSAGGLGAIRTLPVLTVSDGKGFSQAGGIIELYVEGGRMRFAINVDAAERSGLRLSSRLLGLAKIIRDGHVQ